MLPQCCSKSLSLVPIMLIANSVALLVFCPHQAARRLHQRIVQAATNLRSKTNRTRASFPTAIVATPTPSAPPASPPQQPQHLSTALMSYSGTSSEESSMSQETAITTSSSVMPSDRAPKAQTHSKRTYDTMQGSSSHSTPQPSLYEAVFGAQIAAQLHQAAAVTEPKTPPPCSQGSFQLNMSYSGGTPLTPRTPRSGTAIGMSARLHKLSCTPQLGSPERARRGGPPVGVDPHNSPSPQHLQREDELAFAHPHQSYVILSPSRRGVVRKAISSPALSPSKRQRRNYDALRASPLARDQDPDSVVVGMLATMAEERNKSRATTPTSSQGHPAFADPRSITPRRARVMASMMPPNASAAPSAGSPPLLAVTPPTRPVPLPSSDGALHGAKPNTEGNTNKEADLLLYLANSPTARQRSSSRDVQQHLPATPSRSSTTKAHDHQTPSLLDSLERRHRGSVSARTPTLQHRRTGSRDHFSTLPRTLFETDEPMDGPSRDAKADSGTALGPSPILRPKGSRPTASTTSPPIASIGSSSNKREHEETDSTSTGMAKSVSAPASSTAPASALDTLSATSAAARRRQPLERSEDRLTSAQTPEQRAAEWNDSSDEDEDGKEIRRRKSLLRTSMASTPGFPLTPGQEQTRRPRSRFPTFEGVDTTNMSTSEAPRTPSPAPTVSSEPRTPHTPNTAAFAYSDYLNVSPSPNPRSRVMSANGRFPSCNGHIVALEDAMTWGQAIARSANAGRRTSTVHSNQTPTRRRQSSSGHRRHRNDRSDDEDTPNDHAAMLTPGPILYESASPTFQVRSESRRPRLHSGHLQHGPERLSRHAAGSSHRASLSALPLDAGFKEGFGQASTSTSLRPTAGVKIENSSSEVDADGSASASASASSTPTSPPPDSSRVNVGLGLSC